MILSESIRYHFGECKKLYGSRRLSAELKSHGIRASHTTVAKYMQRMGLRCQYYPKFRQTTDSKHSNLVAENLLDRNFKPTAPIWYGSLILLISQ